DGSVTKFSPAGAVLASASGLQAPERPSLDPASGTLFVPEVAGGQVSFLSATDLSLTGTVGGLNGPHATASGNGNLYVTSGYDIDVFSFSSPAPGPTSSDQCKKDGW